MIAAYLAGIPGNGKPFPDGAKMAKIHWTPKMNQYFPDTTVPGTLHDVDFMVKDSKRFSAMQGWARLDAAQRQRFFEALLRAALRLDRLELRAWLRRRLKNPPLAEPIDPASFIFADADIALILRAAGEAAA